jgi:hypothetical protein
MEKKQRKGKPMGRKWQPEEERYLVRHFEKGKSYHELAVMLERTPRSVRDKLRRMMEKEAKRVASQAIADKHVAEHQNILHISTPRITGVTFDEKAIVKEIDHLRESTPEKPTDKPEPGILIDPGFRDFINQGKEYKYEEGCESLRSIRRRVVGLLGAIDGIIGKDE